MANLEGFMNLFNKLKYHKPTTKEIALPGSISTYNDIVARRERLDLGVVSSETCAQGKLGQRRTNRMWTPR
jgi:hypothetical protein